MGIAAPATPERTMKSRKNSATPHATPPESLKIVAPLSGRRLPGFTGDSTSCTKCGNSEAKTIYLTSGQTCQHCNIEGFRSIWGMERLHRVCARCSFSWDEACVPAIQQEIKETLLMPVVPSVRRDRTYT